MATKPFCTIRWGGNSRGQCLRFSAFSVVTCPAAEGERQYPACFLEGSPGGRAEQSRGGDRCLRFSFENSAGGAGEMARWVKALATKPDDLSSSPGAHLVERENSLLRVVL